MFLFFVKPFFAKKCFFVSGKYPRRKAEHFCHSYCSFSAFSPQNMLFWQSNLQNWSFPRAPLFS
jgi:hypothetical protein